MIILHIDLAWLVHAVFFAVFTTLGQQLLLLIDIGMLHRVVASRLHGSNHEHSQLWQCQPQFGGAKRIWTQRHAGLYFPFFNLWLQAIFSFIDFPIGSWPVQWWLVWGHSCRGFTLFFLASFPRPGQCLETNQSRRVPPGDWNQNETILAVSMKGPLAMRK